jgi:RES domain-containing protein
MIKGPLGPIVLYRMHTPQWASQPKSGAGAALQGGRANRPGTPALYMSFEQATAIREYQQLSPLMPPGTLVAYNVRVDPVVDFRAGYNATDWDALWNDFGCDWRQLWFNLHVEPPSWVIGDQVLADGAKGIVFASSIDPSGLNVVLYTETLEATDVLDVFDPHNALPKNRDSWA